MRTLYLRAVRYAQTIDQRTGHDQVHDAWIYYFDKTGENLFIREIPYVLYVVKLMCRRTLQDKYWTKASGEKTPRIFVDIDDVQIANTPTPHDILVSKETIENLHAKIDAWSRADAYGRTGSTARVSGKIIKEFLTYLQHGYTRPEIMERMDISRDTYHKYKNHLKKLMQDLVNSPFAGNKLKVKRITRTEYNKHPEKYEDFTYDTDRWADENEYFTQLVHKSEPHGILIVEAKTIDL